MKQNQIGKHSTTQSVILHLLLRILVACFYLLAGQTRRISLMSNSKWIVAPWKGGLPMKIFPTYLTGGGQNYIQVQFN